MLPWGIARRTKGQLFCTSFGAAAGSCQEGTERKHERLASGWLTGEERFFMSYPFHMALIAQSGGGGVRTARMNRGLEASISNKWQGGLGNCGGEEDDGANLAFMRIWFRSNVLQFESEDIVLARPPPVAVPALNPGPPAAEEESPATIMHPELPIGVGLLDDSGDVPLSVNFRTSTTCYLELAIVSPQSEQKGEVINLRESKVKPNTKGAHFKDPYEDKSFNGRRRNFSVNDHSRHHTTRRNHHYRGYKPKEVTVQIIVSPGSDRSPCMMSCSVTSWMLAVVHVLPSMTYGRRNNEPNYEALSSSSHNEHSILSALSIGLSPPLPISVSK
ncbi:uncharacterized protein EV420DRAFT_1488679 [Desarmillaria tabescens]|uniref:Uncharacterized protein n=1 Tax=Armillaria tabescens TaxID=1929756 RepID=A0AA39J2K8_ARMTA|nr:uncharacterized protein EV420DRAFT_1488679 [Desarmillaria tabescens]KAK0434384.1 hypothetical protein EV420DRAFT_1488679 [Desarmillaria tabescens]